MSGLITKDQCDEFHLEGALWFGELLGEVAFALGANEADLSCQELKQVRIVPRAKT